MIKKANPTPTLQLPNVAKFLSPKEAQAVDLISLQDKFSRLKIGILRGFLDAEGFA
jgi:hypothetical protein